MAEVVLWIIESEKVGKLLLFRLIFSKIREIYRKFSFYLDEGVDVKFYQINAMKN